MEITLLIMEDNGKIMELCFLISLGTLHLSELCDRLVQMVGGASDFLQYIVILYLFCI